MPLHILAKSIEHRCLTRSIVASSFFRHFLVDPNNSNNRIITFNKRIASAFGAKSRIALSRISSSVSFNAKTLPLIITIKHCIRYEQSIKLDYFCK